ncbi:putative RING-9 protein [Rosellinia necatrix]|uniref:Putative RING-9 protein n=1 Tax=Rosellinia necatrix TaxID=77044 RepID=A0A1W2TNG3_ROSNE|nr:putative RING-9 protein [Rosellinia necatrix]
MRPPRIFILAFFSAACLFLLCRAITSATQPVLPASAPRSTAPKSAFRSLFSFTAPFTLFPPNAIITIADDNSTSFAARPAAFGPSLPARGLNGQLWVGSGFSEETTTDGEGEGELGCSDVPGWNDGSSISALKPLLKEVQGKSTSTAESLPSKKWKRGLSRAPAVDRSSTFESESKPKKKPVDDGTDDYLHQHLDKSQRLTNDVSGSSSSGHADIQSIQEGAEIAGKIVLLSRGGCGFLEKVKWAQRRGAIGLIVGDNQRGGPLIQMYAHGDTSNVSIPSIFTSRTTAYLLSLMMQPGSFTDEVTDDSGKPLPKAQYDKVGKSKGTSLAGSSVQGVKPIAALRSEKATQLKQPQSESLSTKPRWFSRLFGGSSQAKAPPSSDSTGPTKAGQLDWVLVEDFSDEKDKSIKSNLEQAAKNKGNSGLASNSRQPVEDDFQIGVEDWRDPDLVGIDKSEGTNPDTGKKTQTQPKLGQAHFPDKSDFDGPGRSGTIPSNADYATSHMPAKGKDAIGLTKGKPAVPGGPGLISKIFGDDGDAEAMGNENEAASGEPPFISKPGGIGAPPPPSEREGLWVVVTPTSGASPFFDTLLVLVISPLITLTVVYALLILRARIRRRRWRAPKSIVERLPVRTYHTVTSTPSRSPRLPSPTSTSPTTPLLQDQHGPSRSRPRSRTTTGVPSTGDLLDVNAALSMPPAPRAEEKRAGSSQWKKYMGRQVECVVCLEEYVDGVSRVMSLPCGHEFHVDCITPWLTTRRRTCPICKGDVVRSFARGMPSSPRYESYRDDTDEEDMLVPDSGPSTSDLRRDENGTDLEQGLPMPRRVLHQRGWMSMLPNLIRDRLFTPPRQPATGVENPDR